MKFNWKWALGIALFVLLLAALVAAPLAIRGYFMTQNGAPQNWRALDAPEGWQHPGMSMRDGRSFERVHGNYGMGMHPGRGFMPMPFLGGFMLFGGLLRLVIPLAVLAGVAYFAYQQGKKAGMKSVQAAIPATAADEPPAS